MEDMTVTLTKESEVKTAELERLTLYHTNQTHEIEATGNEKAIQIEKLQNEIGELTEASTHTA